MNVRISTFQSGNNQGEAKRTSCLNTSLLHVSFLESATTARLTPTIAMKKKNPIICQKRSEKSLPLSLISTLSWVLSQDLVPTTLASLASRDFFTQCPVYSLLGQSVSQNVLVRNLLNHYNVSEFIDHPWTWQNSIQCHIPCSFSTLMTPSEKHCANLSANSSSQGLTIVISGRSL